MRLDLGFLTLLSIVPSTSLKYLPLRRIGSPVLDRSFGTHEETCPCCKNRFLAKDISEDLVDSTPSEKIENEDSDFVSSSMISLIRLYKRELSPLLPPACRFVPTCSVYGVEAIQEFGPWKGFILTCWRLLRCNPFGGKGYDPPQWPPPGWFAGKTKFS